MPGGYCELAGQDRETQNIPEDKELRHDHGGHGQRNLDGRAARRPQREVAEGFARVDADIRELRAEFGPMRKENQQEFLKLRGEIKSEGIALLSEIKGEGDALRGEIKAGSGPFAPR